MSCDYQGHEFGACYLDSVCIDGYLWDADSCDEPGGDLTNGGDIPCPQCNHDSWLLHVGDGIMEDGYTAGYEGKELSECPYQPDGKPGNGLRSWHNEHDPYIFRFAWLKGYWDGAAELRDDLRREKHDVEDAPLQTEGNSLG